MRPTMTVPLLLTCLIACSGEGSTQVGPDTLPEGDWTLTPTARTSDCGDALPAEPEGGRVRIRLDDGGVQDRGNWAQFPCTVTDTFTLTAP